MSSIRVKDLPNPVVGALIVMFSKKNIDYKGQSVKFHVTVTWPREGFSVVELGVVSYNKGETQRIANELLERIKLDLPHQDICVFHHD